MMDTGLGRIRGLRHGDTTTRKSDDPTLRNCDDYIASVLRAESGHLSIGRGNFILRGARGTRLSGHDYEQVKACCIAAGLPVIDSRMARTSLVLLGALRCDMFGSFQLRRHHAPSPPKPRGGDEAGGAGSEEGNNLHRCRNSDALFAPKCQSFLDNVMAVFRFSRSWNDPAGCRSRSANLAMASLLV